MGLFDLFGRNKRKQPQSRPKENEVFSGKRSVQKGGASFDGQPAPGEYDKQKGVFSAFVLLADKSWDKKAFQSELEADWGLQPEYEEGRDPGAKEKDGCELVLLNLGSQRVIVGYMDIPVPNREAEHNAAFNYTWKEAVEVTQRHQAQIVVTVVGAHEDVKKDGELFVKVVSTLCRQSNVLGVYANGVVYQPQFYAAMKEMLVKGIFPLMGLVWFGITAAPHGYNVYTIGMNCFGKDDMEIIETPKEPMAARDFLVDIAFHCIEEDVTLKDGETVGRTAGQKCRITRSPGVSAGGTTLKIAYEKG